MSTTKRSMQRASESEVKSEVKKVNQQSQKFALVPENLYQAVIQTLAQLPVEPFGERAILMLRDLRKCNLVEPQQNGEKKEGKND